MGARVLVLRQNGMSEIKKFGVILNYTNVVSVKRTNFLKYQNNIVLKKSSKFS